MITFPRPRPKSCLLVSILVALAGGGCQTQPPASSAQPAQAAPAAPEAAGASKLESDVAHLNDIVPAQSHTMIDVGYHMSSLWFAARQQNWPLAAFEASETRNRIRWTLRIRPTWKSQDGLEVDMKALFDGIDKALVTPLRESVEKKDPKAFETAYRNMLEGCYQCHKAVGKPYLRPMVPTAPPQTIINYDPNATWPQ